MCDSSLKGSSPYLFWCQKVKVTGAGSLCLPTICFRVITPVWIKQLYSSYTYLSLTIQGRPWGQKVKGQGHRGGLFTNLFLDDN